MTSRSFDLPAEIDAAIARVLKAHGFSLDMVESLAPSVMALSDHFTGDEGKKTPWANWAAYLAYYFPLNVVRLRAVLEECFREFPWDAVTEIIDFGSGPGTFAAAAEISDLEPKPILCVETEARAIQLHKGFGWSRFPCRWTDRLPAQIPTGALGVFSYSLLEAPEVTERLSEFDHVLIVSPSTRSQGRRLLEIRERLMARGFSSWAPCTHQKACPLLTQSKTDWCHDRIHFEGPEWYKRLETRLPIKNDSLTFSYWFGSRTQAAPVHSHRARLIGDTLYEKGKVRQMVCRGPEREFLGWLTRDGEPPRLTRGSLIDLPENIVKKSNELRGYRNF